MEDDCDSKEFLKKEFLSVTHIDPLEMCCTSCLARPVLFGIVCVMCAP